MQQLMKNVNALGGRTDAEILVAAAKSHYDFVLIHPFDDGNGRMARLLMNLVLVKYGFPPAIVRTDDKANYFAALQQADGGQLDVFVEYIAGCVCASLEVMLAGARGEEIDEFDIKARQKILALERLLVTKGTQVAATRSPETVANAIETVLFPLSAIVRRSLEKFSGLLASIKVDYYERTTAHGFGTNSYRPLASREDTQGVAESGQVVLRIELSGVRSVSLFANEKTWDFVVALFDDHLQVQCDPIDLQLVVRYEAALSDEQVRSVDQILTANTIQWLQDVTGIDIEKVFSR